MSFSKMNIGKLLIDFVFVFVVTLGVSVIVTFLWNSVFRGATTIDWETSVRFAIVFGIIFAWVEARRSANT